MSERQWFKLEWRGDAKPQFVCGDDIADAMNRAGIGAGALPALDCWSPVKFEDIRTSPLPTPTDEEEG